jgi:polygalacturonase
MGINVGFSEDLQLQNVYVHDTAGNGIHFVLSRNVIISNCRVNNTGRTGINPNLSGHGIVLNSVDGARITNNQINGSRE